MPTTEQHNTTPHHCALDSPKNTTSPGLRTFSQTHGVVLRNGFALTHAAFCPGSTPYRAAFNTYSIVTEPLHQEDLNKYINVS